MFRTRQSILGHRARGRYARASVLVVLAVLGVLVGRAAQDAMVPKLSFSETPAAFAQDPMDPALEASLTAQMNRDLPMLEDLWGVGGGPSPGLHYLEPPKRIKAGAPLRVGVHVQRLNGNPVPDATVEIVWRLGPEQIRDVTFTDAAGNVEVTHKIAKVSRGHKCVVAVRMYRDDLAGMAYTTFVPR